MPTFEDNDFQIVNQADNTKRLFFSVADILTGHDVVIHMSPSAGSLPAVEALVRDTSTGIVVNDNVIFDEDGGLLINNTANGTVVQLQAPQFGTTTSAVFLPNIDGIVVGSCTLPTSDYVGQTANIGSTTLLTAPPAGQYRITAYLETTSIGVGTNIVTFAWTDGVGATTDASTVLSLTGTGRTSKTINAYVASGNISFSTSGYTSGTFALYTRVEALG